MKFRIIAVMFLTVAATGNAAGEGVDLSVVNRIKDQAFNHSQVMDYMHHLADENGPRLAASPAYQRAARWAVETLKASGISDARLEPFGEFGRSWAWTGDFRPDGRAAEDNAQRRSAGMEFRHQRDDQRKCRVCAALGRHQ